MNRRKLFSSLFLLYLILIPASFAAIDASAETESEMLARWAEDKSNLIPDMLFVVKAEVDVRYGSSSLGVESFSTQELISTLDTPSIASTEDAGLIGVIPDVDVSSDEEDFGVPDMVGDKSFLSAATENRTDAAYTTLNIADNFAATSYPYFLLEDLETSVKTSTTTIKVSFGTSTSANISAAAECYNKTIVSNTIYASKNSVWWNLAYETNTTFPSVINIECSNIDVGGYYIYKFDESKYVSDGRYNILYTDTDQTTISPYSTDKVENTFGRDLFALKVDTPVTDLTIDAVHVEDLNTTKMLSVPSEIDYQSDMHVVMRGWKTASALAKDLEKTWMQQLGLHEDEGDEIIGYNILEAYFQYTLNNGLVKLIKNQLTNTLKSSTDYNTLVGTAMKNTLPVLGVANNDDVFDKITGGAVSIDGFWDSVTDGWNSFTSGVSAVAQKVVDYPSSLIDSLGNAAANVIAPIGQTVTGVAEPITNMVTGTTGNVVNGVVGVAGAAENLGSNIMDSLKWPLIIGLSVLGVAAAIIAGVYFGIIKPKKALAANG